eukprot:2772072-Prymnesium_polylepis.2
MSREALMGAAADAAARLLADAARWQRAFGHAYDNTATRYGGAADGAVDAAVARYASDGGAVRALRDALDTDGNLRAPLVAVHSRGAYRPRLR